MIKHSREDVLKINLNELASAENNYDLQFPHPMRTTVRLEKNGRTIGSIKLGNLITLIGIFNAMQGDGNPGPAIDKFFEALRKEHGQEAVERALTIG